MCVSAILYQVLCGQVSVHHPYTSRVLSDVLEAATTGVFLVSYVCGVAITNNLHPDHMDVQDAIVLHLHSPPPPPVKVAAGLQCHSLAHFSQVPKHSSVVSS